MAKIYSSGLRLVLFALLFSGLSACHSGAKGDRNLAFKDQASVQKVLKGTWILAEYEDSVDAGLTPKFLDYLMKDGSCLSFQAGSLHAAAVGGSNSVNPDPENDILPVSAFSYDPSSNLVILTYGDGAGNLSVLRDTGELILNNDDTLLRLHRIKTLDFERYDAGTCPDISPYKHLVNSKFLAGKYFSADDAAREHHIIFTRCGNVEGAQYIHPSLQGYTEFEPELAQFVTRPDAIYFSLPGNEKVVEFYWEVNAESLTLHPADTNRYKQTIVLTKAN